jgi:hypothetical protein
MNNAFDTTPNGTRYKFVDSDMGQVLLIDGMPYLVGDASGYGSVESEVAGYNIGGTHEACEVWREGDDDEAEILFEGDLSQCWDFVIERLGSPNSTWEGTEEDYIEDIGDEDEMDRGRGYNMRPDY